MLPNSTRLNTIWLDSLAILKWAWLLTNPLAADIRTVLATQVLYPKARATVEDHGVFARNQRLLKHDIVRGLTPHRRDSPDQ